MMCCDEIIPAFPKKAALTRTRERPQVSVCLIFNIVHVLELYNRAARHLLASAASTAELISSLLPVRLRDVEDSGTAIG